MPSISIIIPTYNEEKNIEKCISTLLTQSYKDFELIIVDDGSTDKTTDIINHFIKKSKKIKLIKGEHRGPGFSRNLGAKKAKGKVLVFVDADMIFDKNFIKNLTKPIFSGETIGTEDGRQRASNPDNIWSKCWGIYIVKGKRKKSKKRVTGNIFRAILKSEFKKMGGFDPKYGYADDMTFCFKYGIRSKIVDSAWCYHKNPETLKEVFKQSRWIGASLNNFFLKNKLLKHLTLPFLLLVSPLAILFFSLKKCYKIKNFKLLLPWMFVFMIARYFGIIAGIYNKLYKGTNVR